MSPVPLMAARRTAYDARWGIGAAAWAGRRRTPTECASSPTGGSRRVTRSPVCASRGHRCRRRRPRHAVPGPSQAAKSTECTKGGICYCVNDELKATIASKVERFRQILAEQRKAGKAVGYLSVPLTSAGGGNFNINREVAESAKAAIEKRFGADYVYVLNPATLDADLPKGGGADYMLMWTALLEGPDGLGDFDFVYFAGPQDFARYFGFDGNADMAKLEQYFDQRVKSDPELREGGAERPDQAGVSPLLRVARVGFGEPRRARRMEHLPDDQRTAPRRRQDRHDGPDSGALRRARRQPLGRRGSGLGRLRRQMRHCEPEERHDPPACCAAMARAVAFVPLLALALGGAMSARAADTVNAYSIWPENWARPMFEEFEKATGIKVNFVRFSSGEALARVIAEKNNPRVDVLFGGPVETFAAGIGEGVFESYKSPSFAALPAALQAGRRAMDRDRRRSAGVHDQRRSS